MKYIRTWYGKLFGVAGLSKTGKSVFYISKKSGKQCQMPRNNGDRIADTIEELCDLYVTHYKIGEKDYFYDIRVSLEAAKWFAEKDHPNFDSFKVCAIYSAIWTDEGLIYVAKMNEKGELELI